MTQSTLVRSEIVNRVMADGDATRDGIRTQHDSLQVVIDRLIATPTTTATPDLDAHALDGATSCRRRGDVYARLGMWDAALAQYERAIHGNARDARARCGGAIARYELGDLPGALVFIDEALALEPHSRRARAALYRIVDTELRKSKECGVVD